MRLAMKMTGWIPVSYPAHVPARTFLPRPKGINGVFLSVAGMGSCGFNKRMRRPGTGTGRVLGLRLSFGLRKLSILDGG